MLISLHCSPQVVPFSQTPLIRTDKRYQTKYSIPQDDDGIIADVDSQNMKNK
jgi:hypothetical protein